MSQPLLYSYKMTNDTGFAPNPFGSTLTLATCKPGMRRVRQPGEWIAGFTSEQLVKLGVGNERLIYLMRVGEKLTFEQYFHDKRFRKKQPVMRSRDPWRHVGDNIYQPLKAGAVKRNEFRLLRNPYHSADHAQTDLSGVFVLVADEFYYFGNKAITLPDALRPEVPQGPARYGIACSPDRAVKLVHYIQNKYEPGIHGYPFMSSDDGGCGAGSEGSHIDAATCAAKSGC